MKQKNKFDLLVDQLSNQFAQIKNFELLTESDETKRLWNFLSQTIVEFNSMKGLYIGIYIPQTNKFIYEWKQEFKKSIYSSFIQIDESLWKHEVHQLIRTGYVTLFHKYEGFAGNVYRMVDENYIHFQDKSINLEKYAIKEFDFKIDDHWYINEFIKRINWICNSEKHNEGFPKTTHSYYKDNATEKILHPSDQKIALTAEGLKVYIEIMIHAVQLIFQIVMFIAFYRMTEEEFNSFEYGDDLYNKEQKERLVEMKLKILEVISLLKVLE